MEPHGTSTSTATVIERIKITARMVWGTYAVKIEVQMGNARMHCGTYVPQLRGFDKFAQIGLKKMPPFE